jgi:hypothetical protein
MIDARCYVAQADGPFWPPEAKTFLLHHYVDLGRLRAAGGVLEEDGRFDVAIPGPYVLIDKNGRTTGMLDGVPYHGPVQLRPGMHRFARATNERVAWLWAPAFERGYSPFHLSDLDF